MLVLELLRGKKTGGTMRKWLRDSLSAAVALISPARFVVPSVDRRENVEGWREELPLSEAVESELESREGGDEESFVKKAEEGSGGVPYVLIVEERKAGAKGWTTNSCRERTAAGRFPYTQRYHAIELKTEGMQAYYCADGKHSVHYTYSKEQYAKLKTYQFVSKKTNNKNVVVRPEVIFYSNKMSYLTGTFIKLYNEGTLEFEDVRGICESIDWENHWNIIELKEQLEKDKVASVATGLQDAQLSAKKKKEIVKKISGKRGVKSLYTGFYGSQNVVERDDGSGTTKPGVRPYTEPLMADYLAMTAIAAKFGVPWGLPEWLENPNNAKRNNMFAGKMFPEGGEANRCESLTRNTQSMEDDTEPLVSHVDIANCPDNPGYITISNTVRNAQQELERRGAVGYMRESCADATERSKLLRGWVKPLREYVEALPDYLKEADPQKYFENLGEEGIALVFERDVTKPAERPVCKAAALLTRPGLHKDFSYTSGATEAFLNLVAKYNLCFKEMCEMAFCYCCCNHIFGFVCVLQAWIHEGLPTEYDCLVTAFFDSMKARFGGVGCTGGQKKLSRHQPACNRAFSGKELSTMLKKFHAFIQDEREDNSELCGNAARADLWSMYRHLTGVIERIFPWAKEFQAGQCIHFLIMTNLLPQPALLQLADIKFSRLEVPKGQKATTISRRILEALVHLLGYTVAAMENGSCEMSRKDAVLDVFFPGFPVAVVEGQVKLVYPLQSTRKKRKLGNVLEPVECLELVTTEVNISKYCMVGRAATREESVYWKEDLPLTVATKTINICIGVGMEKAKKPKLRKTLHYFTIIVTAAEMTRKLGDDIIVRLRKRFMNPVMGEGNLQHFHNEIHTLLEPAIVMCPTYIEGIRSAIMSYETLKGYMNNAEFPVTNIAKHVDRVTRASSRPCLVPTGSLDLPASVESTGDLLIGMDLLCEGYSQTSNTNSITLSGKPPDCNFKVKDLQNPSKTVVAEPMIFEIVRNMLKSRVDRGVLPCLGVSKKTMLFKRCVLAARRQDHYYLPFVFGPPSNKVHTYNYSIRLRNPIADRFAVAMGGVKHTITNVTDPMQRYVWAFTGKKPAVAHFMVCLVLVEGTPYEHYSFYQSCLNSGKQLMRVGRKKQPGERSNVIAVYENGITSGPLLYLIKCDDEQLMAAVPGPAPLQAKNIVYVTMEYCEDKPQIFKNEQERFCI